MSPPEMRCGGCRMQPPLKLYEEERELPVRIFLDAPLREAMSESGERIFRAQHSPLTLEVERPQAAFATAPVSC